MSIITEAFRKFNLLEDTINVTKDDADDLKNLLDAENDETENIIDPLAQAEDELQDSYVGKVILDCTICQSKIYKDKSEVVIDEEEQLANTSEECPYCHSISGFKIVGEIAPYCSECEDDKEETEEGEENKEDKEEVDEACKRSRNIPKMEEGLYRGAKNVEFVYNGAMSDPDLVYNGYTFNYWDIEDALWEDFLEETGHKDSESTDPQVNAEFDKYVQDHVEGYLDDVIAGGYFADGSKTWHKADESLKESVDNIKVEADDNSIEVEKDDKKVEVKDEDGKLKVEVSSEEDTEKDEVVVPVDDETKNEIETNSVEEIDIDEFNEEEFDDLGESYLKEVYNNVKSFKTTSGSIDGKKLKLEGVITFKSGKQKKTSFMFEGNKITKTGKVKFIGCNEQLSPNTKAFVITGRINDRKLISESLTYNYTVDSKKLYGTVKRK